MQNKKKKNLKRHEQTTITATKEALVLDMSKGIKYHFFDFRCKRPRDLMTPEECFSN